MFARNVLIADHDDATLERAGSELAAHRCEVFLASSSAGMLDIAAATPCDTAFIDAGLSDGGGLEAARTLAAVSPETLITITGSGQFFDEHAAELADAGFDFQLRPLLLERLLVTIQRNELITRLRRENQMLKSQWEDDRGLDDFISRSPQMIEALRQAATAAETSQSIIITGPRGTEKEIIALYIHRCSSRADKLFVRHECGRPTPALEELDLFGHGSTCPIGRIALARGGTLFLDNITSLSPAAQTRLLRVIDESETDVHVICSSAAEVDAFATSAIRSDLLYRLTQLSITIPALAERRMDILPLANRFLARFALQQGKLIRGISPEATRLLLAYDWPGNIQELKDTIRMAVAVARHQFLAPADFARGPYRLVPNPISPAIPETTSC